MSDVTITIVIKSAGDMVTTSLGGQPQVSGPEPQVIPGTSAADAEAPVPTLSVADGAMAGAGPTPAPLESLGGSGAAPEDQPPMPEDLPETGDESAPRGGRRRS